MRKQSGESLEERDISKVRVPFSLTLRDLITIIAVAMTFTMAWATFGSRMSLAEREILELKQKIVHMKRQLRDLEYGQRNDEIYIDQIYEHLKRAPPNRPQRREYE